MLANCFTFLGILLGFHTSIVEKQVLVPIIMEFLNYTLIEDILFLIKMAKKEVWKVVGDAMSKAYDGLYTKFTEQENERDVF